jgi:two-component system nitrate/nitrite response regulator NarL
VHRVFVVDASPLSRAGIIVILQRIPGTVLVGEADSVATARAALQEIEEPDLVVLGLEHAGEAALSDLDLLRAGHPGRHVALLVPAVSTRWLRQALEHGALAYLSKQCSLAALEAKLALALAGQRAACDPHRPPPPSPTPTPRARMRAVAPGVALCEPETLTLREREVLELIGQGCHNQEIAARLGLATGTVKVHLKNIFRKLGLRSRVDAALWTVGHGAEGAGTER